MVSFICLTIVSPPLIQELVEIFASETRKSPLESPTRAVFLGHYLQFPREASALLQLISGIHFTKAEHTGIAWGF